MDNKERLMKEIETLEIRAKFIGRGFKSRNSLTGEDTKSYSVVPEILQLTDSVIGADGLAMNIEECARRSRYNRNSSKMIGPAPRKYGHHGIAIQYKNE
ncbi:hypothetical protein COU53_03370 [Candidatus Pacearchaeota archaeon CG10_big_fil_rev_8_21_14_0_10_30_48]|nr:MAG: hypothetical protein COU53_03370 [Candidatus Pacearchaeota archaeon CG10_big_fil_rev_8_21_14_0_10_30_48]